MIYTKTNCINDLNKKILFTIIILICYSTGFSDSMFYTLTDYDELKTKLYKYDLKSETPAHKLIELDKDILHTLDSPVILDNLIYAVEVNVEDESKSVVEINLHDKTLKRIKCHSSLHKLVVSSDYVIAASKNELYIIDRINFTRVIDKIIPNVIEDISIVPSHDNSGQNIVLLLEENNKNKLLFFSIENMKYVNDFFVANHIFTIHSYDNYLLLVSDEGIGIMDTSKDFVLKYIEKNIPKKFLIKERINVSFTKDKTVFVMLNDELYMIDISNMSSQNVFKKTEDYLDLSNNIALDSSKNLYYDKKYLNTIMIFNGIKVMPLFINQEYEVGRFYTNLVGISYSGLKPDSTGLSV